MEVKVCGLRSAAHARACAEAGATYAGLNFVTGRRRAITVAQAGPILSALGSVTPVGVFLDQPVDEVLGVAAELGLDWVQLHGAESVEVCGRLQAEGLRVIKALPVGADFDASITRRYARCERLLLDAPEPGSGRRIPADQLVAIEVPFILAGGLNPDNVQAAIAEVHPTGVDAASGVETHGLPDPERIAAFCRNAKETPA